MIFDGKSFARKIIEDLKKLKTQKKLVVIYNPDHKPSRIYTNIKEKVARELGVEFEKIQIDKFTNSQIKDKIQNSNKDDLVNGIMVQVPLGNRDLELEIIGLIDLKKDVDGLRGDSPYLPAVVRAVQTVLSAKCQVLGKSICIIGSKGFVGKKLMQVFPMAIGMDKINYEASKIKDFDIVISATGIANLISDVKPGAVCIDVGYPNGDFAPSTALKASFYTPVPGGIGPVTVACLFQNLLL